MKKTSLKISVVLILTLLMGLSAVIFAFAEESAGENVNVATTAELNAAFGNTAAKTITFTDNITVPAEEILAISGCAVIDLNGFTLSGKVETVDAATLKNGSFSGTLAIGNEFLGQKLSVNGKVIAEYDATFEESSFTLNGGVLLESSSGATVNFSDCKLTLDGGAKLFDGAKPVELILAGGSCYFDLSSYDVALFKGYRTVKIDDGHYEILADAPYVGENGNWWVGNKDVGVRAESENGVSPAIGENGNWWIGDTDTGVKAAAETDEKADLSTSVIFVFIVAIAMVLIITLIISCNAFRLAKRPRFFRWV